ncbi:hypothetical protein EG328_003612 [Venturia inaequalis]|uniref:Multiple RNA-binding domain-containing protein 1 n=1 Tax=Venturia inaequalis TaxID=5025 RepID=A0A8H3Z6G2_VENIN|nr:hypothetical protein EG328_003612 [Venturia inaequalis]
MESSRIFVRNLPPNLSEDDFKTHFSKQHAITDAKYIGHRRIGYVGFKTPEDAINAVKYFNKSFIRMSRIGVELARPASDNSLPSSETHVQTSTADRNVTGANSIIAAKRTSLPVTDNREDNPLKRKRGEKPKDEAENPKLKEFLQVMQKPSKKSWQDEGTNFLGGPVGVAEPEPLMAEAEADSDDGMQTINKKPKPDSRNGQELAADQDDAPQEAIPAREEPSHAKTDANEMKSDADWLRSKTSRLLDLVDDDNEAPTRPSPTPNTHTTTVTITKEAAPTKSRVDDSADVQADVEMEDRPVNADEEAIRLSRRLFLRNLAYSITEDDLRAGFAPFGDLEEVHVPMDGSKKNGKGFAYILFTDAENAIAAHKTMDGSIFQGRLLHVLPAAPKRENKLDEFAISKLPLKQQRQLRRKADATTMSFNWNSLFMNTDAVMSSISSRLGVEKSTLLDPTSSDAAVKQALAETHVIQESKSYFAQNGVDLEAFKSKKRGDTAILVKNFPFGTTPDELRKLFEEHGKVVRFLMPPSGTIAIVEFAVAPEARSAFKTLAYRKMKDSVLFLEPAPKDVFTGAPPTVINTPAAGTVPQLKAIAPKLSTADLLREEGDPEATETATLFVRNLNFTTTTLRMTQVFSPLDGFLSARVKTKSDPKKPGQILSMGFGFLEFRTKEQAQAALAAMNGYDLDGHKLDIRNSQKALDAGVERQKEDKARAIAGRRTKIIIKNLPFEATKKEVRSLFGTFGQLRSVRVPKKFDSTTRGFGFAEFTTPREAQNAMDALRNTHLLGRRLALDFAEADAEDAEEEIERMQKKVGSQIDKVAIQKLTGTGRKKFNVSGDDPEDA